MRKEKKTNGVFLKAYAGTTGVLLATDIDKKKRKGLLGYAVERKAGNKGKKEWLQGLLRFPDGETSKTGKPIDTHFSANSRKSISSSTSGKKKRRTIPTYQCQNSPRTYSSGSRVECSNRSSGLSNERRMRPGQ